MQTTTQLDNVQVPIVEYGELLIRHHDYCVINTDQYNRILSCPSWQKYFYIENDEVRDHMGIVFAKLEGGLNRLWTLDKWKKSDDSRRARAEAVRKQTQVEQDRFNTVQDHLFQKYGMDKFTSEQMLNKMGRNAVNEFHRQIASSTTTTTTTN